MSEEEFERILDGDYEWMASARESIFRDFYLQLTSNQLRPGVVVDYERQAFRMNSKKEYMVFDPVSYTHLTGESDIKKCANAEDPCFRSCTDFDAISHVIRRL